jgi:hypothetical protein
MPIRPMEVDMPRQFVVQLENRPGELAHLARALGARGVNMSHLTCAGTGPLACAFITADDDTAARDVLHGLGHDYLEGETIVVDVLDQPGGLADIAERFAHVGVHIMGTMCVGRREGIMEMAFAVDDIEKARSVLTPAELASSNSSS